MSDQESKTLSTKLKDFSDINVLLSCSYIDDEVSRILSLSDAEVKSLSEQDLKCAIYTLSRFSLHLENIASEAHASFVAIERLLNREVGAVAGEYYNPKIFGQSYEERKALVIKNDEYLNELHNSMIEKEMYYNRVNKLSYRLNDICKKIELFLNRRNYGG